MQDGHCASRYLWRPRDSPLCETEHIAANVWWVDTIVTSEQCQNQLAEYTPNKAFLCTLTFQSQVLDHPSEVSVAAVLHVEMQVL